MRATLTHKHGRCVCARVLQDLHQLRLQLSVADPLPHLHDLDDGLLDEKRNTHVMVFKSPLIFNIVLKLLIPPALASFCRLLDQKAAE